MFDWVLNTSLQLFTGILLNNDSEKYDRNFQKNPCWGRFLNKDADDFTTNIFLKMGVHLFTLYGSSVFNYSFHHH